MSFNFKKSAQQSVSLSSLHAGRTQLDTAAIVGQTLTIEQFDIAFLPDKNGEVKSFAVIVFKEMPQHYYNGGFVLTKIVETWVNAFHDKVDDFQAAVALANDAYRAAADDVQVKAVETRTKSGNNLVSIEVL